MTGLGDGGLVIGFEAVVLQAPLFVLPVEVGPLLNQHLGLANERRQRIFKLQWEQRVLRNLWNLLHHTLPPLPLILGSMRESTNHGALKLKESKAQYRPTLKQVKKLPFRG